MTQLIKQWVIIALCLHIIAGIWYAASPTRLGAWEAARDIAYDSIWLEYAEDTYCGEDL
jgi:cbb3-type cytochrome oxidase subunit 3